MTEKAITSSSGSSSSKNIVELRRKSEARATTKLINDTANAIKEQLLASSTNGNISAGGKQFREAAVEWLVRAWVLRESIHKRDEPELGLMYERLGEAHMSCKTLENYEEGASMFRTALDIFNKNNAQTPVKARVAERLGRAEMLYVKLMQRLVMLLRLLVTFMHLKPIVDWSWKNHQKLIHIYTTITIATQMDYTYQSN